MDLDSVVTTVLLFGISVARRLLMEETVEYEGQTLTLSSCKAEACKNNSSFSLACGQPASLSCSSVVIKQCDLLHSQKVVSSNSSTESDDEILTNWWRPLDSVEQTKPLSPKQHSSNDVDLQLPQYCMDLDLDQPGSACNLKVSDSSSSSSQSSESGSVRDLMMESGKDVEDDVAHEKLDKSAIESSSYEQLDIERPQSEEYQSQKISFPDEKLLLIHKLVLSGCLEFGAKVCVKLDKHVVKISGTVDEIKRTNMELHELVVSFVTAGVSISETSAKLLSTKVGEDWLDARLANEQLVAVFFVSDTMPVIMTKCQDGLTRVKRIIESSLVTKYRQLEHHHTKLLQSAVWNECIEDLQSAHLLRISVDYGADMRLVVEGSVDSVEVALDKLDKMLGENSRISHRLKLRRGIYRVLHFRSHEIQLEAKYVTCCLCLYCRFLV